MSLLNTLDLKYPLRKENKADKELKSLVSDFDIVLETANKILSKNMDYLTTDNTKLKAHLLKEIEVQNKNIATLRKTVLSEKMLVSKNNATFDVYSEGEKQRVVDVYSMIGMCPRAKVSEIKDLADKFGFCVFDENVFNEENKSKNAVMAKTAATVLRDNDYKIYYLSPLSGFDYASFINSGKGVYDILSYWGQHLQTFNTLALSLNVFRDLYSIVDTLKQENEDIRKAIDSDRQRVSSFHAQFKQYVSHVYSNLRLIEKPLNDYIDDKNTKLMSDFKTARSSALQNNERYKNNRYERNEYIEVYSKATGEYCGTDSFFDFFDESYDDYKTVKRVDVIDNFVPVPEKAFQYDRFVAKKFDVKDLETEKELKARVASYNIANIKKLIQSELGNNYMMIAVKGDIVNPDQDDAIVLSSWGEGVSEETMIGMGVK